MTAWCVMYDRGCRRATLFCVSCTSSSEGSGSENGSLPIKIYDISSKVIPQEPRGDTDNRSIIISSTPATSNSSLIKSPITFYAGGVVISQDNQTKELYNYYWTSYSRGTDGRYNNGVDEPTWLNPYLNGYTSKHTKSLYDPCPYLYRTPTNGTYNLFPKDYPTWTIYSYLGGAKWTSNSKSTWLPSTGYRGVWSTGLFYAVGYRVCYWTATPSNTTTGYGIEFRSDKTVWLNYNSWYRAEGMTVRCIEDCDPQSEFYNIRVTKTKKRSS